MNLYPRPCSFSHSIPATAAEEPAPRDAAAGSVGGGGAANEPDHSVNPLKAAIVYVHGESFEWNSGNLYDGTMLAAHGDVIVVTINFRLGILGKVPETLCGYYVPPERVGSINLMTPNWHLVVAPQSATDSPIGELQFMEYITQEEGVPAQEAF